MIHRQGLSYYQISDFVVSVLGAVQLVRDGTKQAIAVRANVADHCTGNHSCWVCKQEYAQFRTQANAC